MSSAAPAPPASAAQPPSAPPAASPAPIAVPNHANVSVSVPGVSEHLGVLRRAEDLTGGEWLLTYFVCATPVTPTITARRAAPSATCRARCPAATSTRWPARAGPTP